VRAKFIFESINDVLLPKSDSELKKSKSDYLKTIGFNSEKDILLGKFFTGLRYNLVWVVEDALKEAKKGDIDINGLNGQALDSAIKNDNVEMAELLLKYGANVRLRDYMHKAKSNVMRSLLSQYGLKESNVFKPKSPEEIRVNVEREFPISDVEDATGHLRSAIQLKNVEYVKHALRYGGRALDDNYEKISTGKNRAGNLWYAFNESAGDDILIELLKSLIDEFKNDSDFRIGVLRKAIYMGNVGVVEWVLNRPELSQLEAYDAILEAQEWGLGPLHSPYKGFKGYDEAELRVIQWLKNKGIDKWLEKHGEVPLKPLSQESRESLEANESVSSLLKPKTWDEISKLKIKELGEIDKNIESFLIRNGYEYTYDESLSDGHWAVHFEKQEGREHIGYGAPKIKIVGYRNNEDYQIPRIVNESAIGDILRPKSDEEVSAAIENISLDEYADFVMEALEHIADDSYDLKRYAASGGEDLMADGFMKKIPPAEFAHQIAVKYFSVWKPDGSMPLTNTGGIEIKLTSSNDGVEYRFTGDVIPKAAEIEYELDTDQEYEEDEDVPARAFFKDDNDNKWYLDDFMVDR
jgi:hypothetical protein